MVDFGGGGQNPVQTAQPKVETQLAPTTPITTKRPKPKREQATFMGGEFMAPGSASANFGGKTLMGE